MSANNVEGLQDVGNCVNSTYIKRLKDAAEKDIADLDARNLTDLQDVSLSGVGNNDGLAYDSSSGQWIRTEKNRLLQSHYSDGHISGIIEHFEGDDVNVSPFFDAFAGAPFVPPLASTLSAETYWRCVVGGAGDRMFRYKSVNVLPTDNVNIYTSVVMIGNVNLAGLRVDDGTDNNYAEWGVKNNSALYNGTVDLVSRQRVGGGAVTETVTARGVLQGTRIIFRIILSSNGSIACYHTTNSPLYVYTHAAINPRAFTVQRIGITLNAVTANSQAWFDFAHHDL